MGDFKFVGTIPASKSMMNRALLIQSYFPDLKIEGSSECDDVLHMKSALKSLEKHLQEKSNRELNIECGEGGTVLRFMALRVARERGVFRMRGSRRLFQRPHQELLFVLQQLGVTATFSTTDLKIVSEGWKKPLIPIAIHRQISSQFVTSLLLNSWKLPWAYGFDLPASGVSEGYWKMSLKMALQVGLQIKQKENHFQIDEKQTAVVEKIATEMDFSSAFALCAAAVLAGDVEIQNFSANSLQPDAVFVEIFKQMKIPFAIEGAIFRVKRSDVFEAISIDVSSTPDLVPVLAVLCAFAVGESVITGVQNLEHKESDRLKKTLELLTSAGFSASESGGALRIVGCAQKYQAKSFWFNPDQDHRMAMAAGLLMKKGFAIRLTDPSVVKKSYTTFWKDLGFHL